MELKSFDYFLCVIVYHLGFFTQFSQIAPVPNHTADYNQHCTINGGILELVVVKRYYFQYKMFVSLVWLNSNHMFGLDNFWHKSPSLFLKSLKLPSFYFVNFRFLKSSCGQFIPNHPSRVLIVIITYYYY